MKTTVRRPVCGMTRSMTRGTTGRLLAGAAILFALQGVSHGDDLWDIYQIALHHDATYRAASYEYESARRDLPIAKSALHPSLTIRGSNGWVRNDIGDNTETESERQSSLNLDWPIYDRARRSEVSQAKLAVARAKIRFDEAHHALILRVADRYFQLLAAHDSKEVAHRQKLAIQRQMDFASERLSVGLGTETDLFDAQARFQQAVADAIEADNLIDNAVQALRQIIGATPEALATLGEDAPLDQPTPASVDAWIARSRENNLALMAENLNLKIAEIEIKKQRAARWPRLNLNASQMRRDSSGQTFGADDTASAGATLEWPLYLGGTIWHKSKQAGFLFNAAEQSWEELRRQVESDTISAYLAVTNGISQVKALSEAVRAGTSALRAKDEGFRAGLTTNLDVLDAQRDLARSQTDYLSARYDFILSVLRLEETVGDLDETDLKKVNAWLSHGP